ncbi:MAG: HAD-IIA family hydrolase [Anaerolineae bacterium]
MTDGFDLGEIQGAMIDMDGVLWRGAEPMPGLAEFFALLRDLEIPFVLATNNASKAPDVYVDRLAGHGVAIEAMEVLTSSLAAASYLRELYAPGSTAYVVGGPGLGQALTESGFEVLTDADEQAAFVVVGIDFGLTYDKLAYAALHLQRGARFFATNADPSYPAESGRLPGAGSILAAVETATGQTAEVIGKPHRRMFDAAMERLATPRRRTVMIGDRLDTDIAGARNAGLRSVLVTGGADGPTMSKAVGVEPDAFFDDIAALTTAWSAARG